MTGKQILHYRILEELGRGGMGVVYKAVDSKLERVVALKFLPTNTLAGEEEKNRFKREAKAAAALNHPNICHIYTIDEADEQLFIAMEFIEGKSLAEIVGAKGGTPLQIADAINYATLIAAGLQTAHEKGIIHRDIKSSNILITEKGQVKIMDFGLAKVAGGITITRTGTTMGTLAYMSPEQLQGEIVDQRSDIWSFGVVLYEMISGQLPFRGEYDQAIMYSICHEEPQPLTALRTGVPLALDGIIAKALAKDPSIRYQHVDELPADLKAARETPRSTSRNLSANKWQPPQKKQIWSWAIATILLGMLAGVAAWEWLRPVRSTPAVVTRFHVPLPEGQHAAERGVQVALALSPDGKYLVYVGIDGNDQRLYLRSMDALQAKPIAGTEGASTPFFSPDGEWIGFFADNMLKKVPTSGGPIVQITQAPGEAAGATWNHDDVIVYTLTYRAGLKRVSARGGEPEVLTTPDREKNEISHRFAQFLPDGNSLLFHDFYGKIWILSLTTGERKFITDGRCPFYLPGGYLIYSFDGWLHAARFDPDRLELTGTGVPLIAGIAKTTFGGAHYYAVSQTGTLAYFTATEPNRKLILADRDGREQDVGDVRGELRAPRFSPDGRRLAILKGWYYWIYEIEQNTLSRLGTRGWDGQWTSDGKRLIFNALLSGNYNIYSIATDFSGKLDTVATSVHDIAMGSVSRDGQWLAYVEIHPTTNHDIWALNLRDGKAPAPILITPYNEDAARLSPDGRWLAYASDESDRREVYIRAFPGPGNRWQVSANGGMEPVWSPNGKELFYRQENKLIAAALEISSTIRVAKRTVLFEKENLVLHTFGTMRAYYDVHPNGKQFVMVQKVKVAEPELIVVSNWIEELKRLLPANE